MRLSGPTLRDELRSKRLRSLRVFLLPALVALVLYAFYSVGGYGVHEPPAKPLPHGNLYGTVIDEKKRPVSGVSVTISYSNVKEPMPASAPDTDAQGHFYLQDLPAGLYILQATAEGFEMQTQSMNVEPGKTTQIKMPIYRKQARTRPAEVPLPIR
jgi:hypothetical protein